MINKVAVSIVSHGHGAMVERLIDKILTFDEVEKIFLTLNIQEKIELPNSKKLIVIKNERALGFGKNHNSIFKKINEKYFCVLNPDIIFNENPFPALIAQFASTKIALVAPSIFNLQGNLDDSARFFPSIRSLIKKLLFNDKGSYKFKETSEVFNAEWVGGMFMLFKSDYYYEINGFDEKYYMYYEDADICTRLWKKNLVVLVCPAIQVIHCAQRASRRNIQHFKWHVASMVRYLIRYTNNLPSIKQ
jgi:N-acetylglucosaminyl-diphospho-decaprenol L-rhamnosyltransferase